MSTPLANALDMVHWYACAIFPYVWKYRYYFPYGVSFIFLLWLFVSDLYLIWTDTRWTFSETLSSEWYSIAMLLLFLELQKTVIHHQYASPSLTCYCLFYLKRYWYVLYIWLDFNMSWWSLVFICYIIFSVGLSWKMIVVEVVFKGLFVTKDRCLFFLPSFYALPISLTMVD